MGATIDRCERPFEFAISRTGATIATAFAVSTNSRMLNSVRIVKLIADPSCAHRSLNQSSKSNLNSTEFCIRLRLQYITYHVFP